MCKRTMCKRARIPMFLWERRACSNSGAQAVFPRPRKNGLGTRLPAAVHAGRAGGRRRRGRCRLYACAVLQSTLHSHACYNTCTMYIIHVHVYIHIAEGSYGLFRKHCHLHSIQLECCEPCQIYESIPTNQ